MSFLRPIGLLLRQLEEALEKGLLTPQKVLSKTTQALDSYTPPPVLRNIALSTQRRSPLEHAINANFLKESGWLRNFLDQRKFGKMLPTVMMALNPKKPALVREGEIGISADGLNWPALRAFDSGVLAKFHRIRSKAGPSPSKNFVSGGLGGHAGDSFTIEWKGQPSHGPVFLERDLLPGLVLHAKGLVTSQSYSIPRGREFQMAPDQVWYMNVDDCLSVSLTLKDATLREATLERAQQRFKLADKIAQLSGIGEVEPEAPWNTPAIKSFLDDLESKKAVVCGTLDPDQHWPETVYLKPKKHPDANVFLAALIDVFERSDDELTWLTQKLRDC